MTATDPTPEAAPPTPDEGVSFDEAHGQVVLRFGGVQWRLRRPTFGEFRRANEAIERVRAETLAATEGAAASAANGNDPVLGLYAGVAGHRLAFWREIVPMLSGAPLPESDDELPYWLVSADLINDATEHWLVVPRVAPGV